MTAFAGAPEIDHFKISFPTTVLADIDIRDKSRKTQHTVNAFHMMAIHSHDGTSSEMQNTANNGAGNEKPSATNAVNEGQYEASGD